MEKPRSALSYVFESSVFPSIGGVDVGVGAGVGVGVGIGWETTGVVSVTG